jgi:hypothetical protein
MCLEMGLHRRDALVKSFPDEEQWVEITRLFWAVYSLDRRWSLGTGLPFVIQDEDIDPNLPEPVRLHCVRHSMIEQLTCGNDRMQHSLTCAA